MTVRKRSCREAKWCDAPRWGKGGAQAYSACLSGCFQGRISGCLNSVLSNVVKIPWKSTLINANPVDKGAYMVTDRIPDPTLEFNMSVTMREMLEAGVQFGNQTRIWKKK